MSVSEIIKKFLNKLMRMSGIFISFRKPEIINEGRRIFSWRNFKKTKRGFYELSPMPSIDELDKFYSSAYWNAYRLGIKSLLRKKDLSHFFILSKFFDFNQAFKRNSSQPLLFLNFGAGHGGISHLMRIFEFDVANIEYDQMDNIYEYKFNQFKSIKEFYKNITKKVDIFYSSHSMEHVQNIDDFIDSVQKITDENTIFFIEVPDGDSPRSGPNINKVEIAHTYYFTKEFFYKFFKEVIYITNTPERKNIKFVDKGGDVNKSLTKNGPLTVIAKGLIKHKGN